MYQKVIVLEQKTLDNCIKSFLVGINCYCLEPICMLNIEVLVNNYLMTSKKTFTFVKM